MARISIVFYNENLQVVHSEKGVLYESPTYLKWDSNKEKITLIGAQAPKNIPRNHGEERIVRPLGKQASDQIILKKFFQQVFAPLKEDFINNDVVFGLPMDLTKEAKTTIKNFFKSYKINSLHFIPTIFLLAIGAHIDLNDDYGVIMLTINTEQTEAAIIANQKIVNYQVLELGERTLDEQIIIFFKEKFKLIIDESEINRVKFDLASLTSNKQELAIVFNGQDLVTEQEKQILVSDLEVKKLFTSLFTHYRSMIIHILEGSPGYIRTGIAKNGLFITGSMCQIHGIADYFTNFFEFPTKIVTANIGVISQGALNAELQES